MDINKLLKVKLASIFIIISFLGTSILSATGGVVSPQLVTNSDEQVVGVYGDQSDSAVSLSMEAYINTIDCNFQILSFSQILKFQGQVVIFAHGDEQGIILSKNLLFTWDAFSSLLSSAKAEKIILASCFGVNANNDQYTGPELISWEGYIDGLLIGYAAAYFTLLDDGYDIEFVLNKLFNRAILLACNKVEPLYLAYIPGDDGGGDDLGPSESGYEQAYKLQNTGSGLSSGRIFWVNFDVENSKDLVALNIALIAFSGGEVAAINPAVFAVIIAILVVNTVLIMISKANRIRHDSMFGVQFFKYLPLVNFVYHNGNDGYKLSGVIYIPQICASGIIAYFGIANVPTVWTYFRM